MIIFTSICANYLHKAKTLAYSVKKHIPDSYFIVCLLEKELADNYDYTCFDEVVLAKDAWGDNFNNFIFKHKLVEASTAVKGQFFRYLQNRFHSENCFVYLDPDTFVYSDFSELRELLQTQPIILCPHLLCPGNIDMELSSLAHGVYNLGFLAVNNSEEAHAFIKWWADRLYLFCYDDKARGIFTDQKWIGLVPCFFETLILKHHGYDFATWSLLGCDIEKIDNNYFVSGDPLRFIHYSGYRETIDNCIRNWLPEEHHHFKDLYAEYAVIHDKNDEDSVSGTPWSYAYFDSGEAISDETRIVYRSNSDWMSIQEDPYTLSNDVLLRIEDGSVNLEPASAVQPRLQRYVMRAVEIVKQDGFFALFKKIFIKLSRMVTKNAGNK